MPLSSWCATNLYLLSVEVGSELGDELGRKKNNLKHVSWHPIRLSCCKRLLGSSLGFIRSEIGLSVLNVSFPWGYKYCFWNLQQWRNKLGDALSKNGSLHFTKKWWSSFLFLGNGILFHRMDAKTDCFLDFLILDKSSVPVLNLAD